jgi:hypothetical protein
MNHITTTSTYRAMASHTAFYVPRPYNAFSLLLVANDSHLQYNKSMEDDYVSLDIST